VKRSASGPKLALTWGTIETKSKAGQCTGGNGIASFSGNNIASGSKTPSLFGSSGFRCTNNRHSVDTHQLSFGSTAPLRSSAARPGNSAPIHIVPRSPDSTIPRQPDSMPTAYRNHFSFSPIPLPRI